MREVTVEYGPNYKWIKINNITVMWDAVQKSYNGIFHELNERRIVMGDMREITDKDVFGDLYFFYQLEIMFPEMFSLGPNKDFPNPLIWAYDE